MKLSERSFIQKYPTISKKGIFADRHILNGYFWSYTATLKRELYFVPIPWDLKKSVGLTFLIIWQYVSFQVRFKIYDQL